MPPLIQFTTWLVIGLLGGSAAAMAVKRERKGFGLAVNLALGSLGAIVGGAVFHLFGILPKLDSISVSARDLLSAFFGSLLVLAVLWAWQRHTRASSAAADHAKAQQEVRFAPAKQTMLVRIRR